jgi:hypothetical protein
MVLNRHTIPGVSSGLHAGSSCCVNLESARNNNWEINLTAEIQSFSRNWTLFLIDVLYEIDFRIDSKCQTH